MEVILLERIEKLGQMGDVVKVKPGYARNFLLPHRKALRATKENLAQFESQRVQLETANLKRRQDAEAVSGKMEGLSVVILRQAGESGQLYGSVTPRDIAQAITAAGFTVERRQVLLDQPIKTRGIHRLRVALHPEVAVAVSLNVAQSAEEAEMQAAGKTIGIGAEDEEAEAELELATEAPVEAAPEAPEAEPEAEAPAEPEAAPAKKSRKGKTER